MEPSERGDSDPDEEAEAREEPGLDAGHRTNEPEAGPGDEEPEPPSDDAGAGSSDGEREAASEDVEEGSVVDGSGAVSDDGSGVGSAGEPAGSGGEETDVSGYGDDGDVVGGVTGSPAPVQTETEDDGFAPADVGELEADGAAASDAGGGGEPREDVPERVRKYDRFKKVDRAEYDRVNDFIRKRTYITAREWAISRLCSDFRTETGVEMTLIGENLPRLVPFMEDTYTPQAVNQARSAFEDKVKMSGSTFLYGAMSGFFTTEELDEMMYEVSETARFLLEVEGVEIGVEHETEVQDRISDAMRDIRESSRELRGEEDDETHRCPECGHEF